MSTLLLLAGATLLVTWLVTPAASAPPLQTPAPHTSLDDDAPLLADVNAQVRDLHDRIGARPAYPEPVRDPFGYASRVSRPRAAVSRVVPEPVAAPVPVDPPPVLVAIQSASATSPRRAVLAAPGGDDVEFVVVGGTIGRFVVRDIEDDAIVLDDPETKATTRLALR